MSIMSPKKSKGGLLSSPVMKIGIKIFYVIFKLAYALFSEIAHRVKPKESYERKYRKWQW